MFDTFKQAAANITGTNEPLKKYSYSQYPGLEDFTLGQVTVQTSHNSYLVGAQHAATTTPEGMRIALEAGCRCVEMDIFNNESNDPVVAHGKEHTGAGGNIYTTLPVPLAEFLAVIQDEAFKITKEPLFIAIENNTNRNVECQNKMVALITGVFGDQRYTGQISPSTPIAELMGKVVIITGGGNAGDFPTIVNGRWGNNGLNNTDNETNPDDLDAAKINRVYPAAGLSGCLSLNFDGNAFIPKGGTFVAMNIQSNDTELQNLRETWFSQHGIRPLPNQQPQSGAPPQDNWKWCNKCAGFTYAAPKPCPAGELHDFGGSGGYVCPFRKEVYNANMQEGWRWCNKCHGLCFEDGEGKPCPGGENHNFQGSGAYVAHCESGGEPQSGAWKVQKGWRWCSKCSVLHFPCGGAKPCAAGGLHTDSGSGAYFTLSA